jgi:hypothetical protein
VARADFSGRAPRRTSRSNDGNPSYALWSWQVTPRGEGSTLTVTWTVHPKTFWRRLLLARVRRGFLADEVRDSVAGLDDYLVKAGSGTTGSH